MSPPLSLTTHPWLSEVPPGKPNTTAMVTPQWYLSPMIGVDPGFWSLLFLGTIPATLSNGTLRTKMQSATCCPHLIYSALYRFKASHRRCFLCRLLPAPKPARRSTVSPHLQRSRFPEPRYRLIICHRHTAFIVHLILSASDYHKPTNFMGKELLALLSSQGIVARTLLAIPHFPLVYLLCHYSSSSQTSRSVFFFALDGTSIYIIGRMVNVRSA